MSVELQRALALAALDRERQTAAALLRPDIAPERLIIHRNNVVGSLIEVLAAACPSVVHALGGKAFQAIGRDFVTRHPPRAPQLWAYGAGFAEFLAASDRGPPWLPDLARLDRAMHETYFAPDAEKLDPNRLAALVNTDDPAGLRFAFHPSVALVSSNWPIYSVWRGCRDPEPAPEAVLVARPELEVLCRRLEPWQAGFLAVLLHDGTLGAAAAHAPIEAPAVAIQDELTRLLHDGLIIGCGARI
ncbi:MAG: DNA-binding domain-containing protein [Rhodospirillaceae bacterium]